MKALCNYISKYMGLLVLAAALLALAFPEVFDDIPPTTINYMLGVVMFGMGMTLNLHDFKVVGQDHGNQTGFHGMRDIRNARPLTIITVMGATRILKTKQKLMNFLLRPGRRINKEAFQRVRCRLKIFFEK